MTDPSRRHTRPTAAEALRARYIDFEGGRDQPPVLLGAPRRGRGPRPHVQQDVVDAVLRGLLPRYPRSAIASRTSCVEASIAAGASCPGARTTSTSSGRFGARTRGSSSASRPGTATPGRSPSPGATGCTAAPTGEGTPRRLPRSDRLPRAAGRGAGARGRHRPGFAPAAGAGLSLTAVGQARWDASSSTTASTAPACGPSACGRPSSWRVRPEGAGALGHGAHPDRA